ncbi:MAG: hypothetical protein ACXVIR_12075 [Halobacteriota archaeon]
MWAVKKAARKRLTPKEIKDIQMIGRRTLNTPHAYYAWSHDVPLTGPSPLDNFSRELFDYRALRMEFRDDHPLTFLSRLAELRAGGRSFPGEERLIELLEDKHVAAAVDDYIRVDGRAVTAVIMPKAVEDRLINLRVDVPSDLVRTWVTAFVKAASKAIMSDRYDLSSLKVTTPRKLVFHWRSLHSGGFAFEKLVVEEPDLCDPSPYVQSRERIIAPKESPLDDEVVICIDGIDVRKKVFYAPFDDWDPRKQIWP